MIGITGKRSTIVKEFLKLNKGQEVFFGRIEDMPFNLDSYFLCAGVLVGKNANSISDEEANQTMHVNFIDIVRFCDNLFDSNNNARVCIMGSQSGVLGSHDAVYAGSKAALHLYVKTKKLLHQNQHLVCIAPSIIEDTGMTQRRADLDKVIARGKEKRLRRLLSSQEVARVANFALKEDALCNEVINVTGGNW